MKMINKKALVVLVLVFLALVGFFGVRSAAAALGPDTTVINGNVQLEEPGDRISADNDLRVHFREVFLEDQFNDGFVVNQVYMESTRVERQKFGLPEDFVLFKSARSMFQAPFGRVATLFITRSSVWIPYKFTQDGGETFTRLMDKKFIIILHR